MLDFLLQVCGDVCEEAGKQYQTERDNKMNLKRQPPLVTFQFGLEININLLDVIRKQKEKDENELKKQAQPKISYANSLTPLRPM